MAVNAKGKVKKAGLRGFLVNQEAILPLKRTLGLTGAFLEGHALRIAVARVPHASLDLCCGSACNVVTLELNLVMVYHGTVPSLFPCRLGEVTLKDFKVAIDREGTHRYHFKALDPEFGTVKEEVSVEFSCLLLWVQCYHTTLETVVTSVLN